MKKDHAHASQGDGHDVLPSFSIGSFFRGRGGLAGLTVLAVQFGVQPLLTKGLVTPGTLTSSLVLVADVTKLIGAFFLLWSSGCIEEAFKGWTLRGCLIAAGLPSVTYLIQNFCVQIAYQSLDPVAFNILNQSKVLFTAFFSYVINGRGQSMMQCGALGLITVGGILVSMPHASSAEFMVKSGAEQESTASGLLCALIAAALSGLGSGVTEWSLQRQLRNNFVLTIEIACLGIVMVSGSLLLNLTPDAEIFRRDGLFVFWDAQTVLPVVVQGFSGILVGFITKHSGGVRKVVATICGLVLTCMLQQFVTGDTQSSMVRYALPVVAVGVYMHAKYPPQLKDSKL